MKASKTTSTKLIHCKKASRQLISKELEKKKYVYFFYSKKNVVVLYCKN
jgi:hypothetical protein